MAKAKAADKKQVKITLKKSTISCTEKQKATVAALGLKKIGQTTLKTDNETLRGMLVVVNHLVTVEEVQA